MEFLRGEAALECGDSSPLYAAPNVWNRSHFRATLQFVNIFGVCQRPFQSGEESPRSKDAPRRKDSNRLSFSLAKVSTVF